MSNPLFDHLFAPHAERAAHFITVPGGRDISYAEFLRQAARYAHAIVACGVRAGDRVAVRVDKSPEALMLYTACVQSGAVFLPLNPAYTATELSYFIEDSGAALMICDGG